MTLAELRTAYHKRLCSEIVRITAPDGKPEEPPKPKYPNFADGDNRNSRNIAWNLIAALCDAGQVSEGKALSSGTSFEGVCRDFLQDAFALLAHVRPGEWGFARNMSIAAFDQYFHLRNMNKELRDLREAIKDKPELLPFLESFANQDYIVRPDIVVYRAPLSDDEINQADRGVLDSKNPVAELTPCAQRTQAHRTRFCTPAFPASGRCAVIGARTRARKR